MSICWIAGWPHNGSTLLREILQQCFGIQSHSLYVEPDFKFLFGEQAETFAREWRGDPINRLDYYRQTPECCFIKTHELPIDDSPVLLVIRDGRDAITALSRFWKVPIQNLIVGQGCPFGDWSNYIRVYQYLSQRFQHFNVIRFEQMVREPMMVARMLADDLRLPEPKPYQDSYEENQKHFPQLYNGRIHIWKEVMSRDDIELFWRCHGQVMEDLGYER